MFQNASHLQCSQTTEAHSDSIFSIVTFLSQDGDTCLGTGSQDLTIKLWISQDNKWQHHKTLAGHRSIVSCLWPLQRRGALLSVSHDSTACCWDLQSGVEEPLWTSRLPSCLLSVVADVSEQTVAVGCGNGKVYLLDSATGETTSSLDGHQHQVWRLAFSPDGSLLASGEWVVSGRD